MLDPQQSIAGLVLDHAECAAVLQRRRIDFCCNGEQTVEAAAVRRGLDPNVFVAELTRAIDERRTGPRDDPRGLSTPELIAHIVSTHDSVRVAMPFIRTLAAKVSRVHGDGEPRLRELEEVVEGLAEALLRHLDEEERFLFAAMSTEKGATADFDAKLAAVQADHATVAGWFARVRDVTGDFTTPAGACTSYRALFSELAQLESDVLLQVHLENHVLWPRFRPRASPRPG